MVRRISPAVTASTVRSAAFHVDEDNFFRGRAIRCGIALRILRRQGTFRRGGVGGGLSVCPVHGCGSHISVIVIIPDFNHLVFAGLAIGHLGCQIREIHGFWKNQIAVRVQGKDSWELPNTS